MNSKTVSAKSVVEMADMLANVVKNDFHPTLAITFSSAGYDLKELSQVFTKHNIDLIGSTTAGEICDKEIYENSIVVLLMDMNKSHYKTHFIETEKETTFKIAKAAGVYAKESFENPGVIVFSGGIMVDGEQIVFGMKAGAGGELPLHGGMAGDDQGTDFTYVFSNEKVSSDGLLSLIIDTDKIELKGMATSGWEPIGNVNTITKSEGNVVYSINEEPALDVFIKYFGSFNKVNNDSTREELVHTLSGQYPLQILRDEGHRILRSPVMADQEKRTLILAGGVREGDQFRFSISPGFEVIDQTLAEFSSFNKEVSQADAMLLISCKGRHAAFGPMLEEEVKGISDYWNAPMIGFMAYGEIGPNQNGTCELHNETCSLVTFKEK